MRGAFEIEHVSATVHHIKGNTAAKRRHIIERPTQDRGGDERG